MKTIKGTFVPNIIAQIRNFKAIITMEVSALLGNSCSMVSKIGISVLLNNVNIMSIMFEVVRRTDN